MADAAGSGSGPVVNAPDGPVQGKAAGTTDEYLGIPYAAPPVGALRWMPPQPAAHWTAVRDATSFGKHCPQGPSFFGKASMSEDCLYLNVFAPQGTSQNLPVMAWIHGGSLEVGESDDYGPAALASQGVIVVTINYRLGALGFLADPALDSPDGKSGNYGLMDQQEALRWVQRNISAFGGNPQNVTLFGESAGGLSTLAQLASPKARGLFQQAIVESGTYNLATQSLADAESASAKFAASIGCPGDNAACLRDGTKATTASILANESAAGYTPAVDGSVLTEPIGAALASGDFNQVPVIIGANHDEWRLFTGQSQAANRGAPTVTASNYMTALAQSLGLSPDRAAQVAGEYPVGGDRSAQDAFSAAMTDTVYACTALTAEQDLSKYMTTVYAYEFNDQDAPQRFAPPVAGFSYGAAHASELQYLFDLSGTPYPAALTQSQPSLATAMQRDWANFAATGVPDAGWPRFDATSQQVESLTTPAPQPLNVDYATEHHCPFWAKFWAAS
jgi:para-nitrobenzyl esterase